VNNLRIIRCGNTTLVIGQLFDPEDLVNPSAFTNAADVATHCFDRFGMLRPSNDNDQDECRSQLTPGDRHRT